MVKPTKFNGEYRAVSVHRLVLFLEASNDTQVPRVKACPNCHMAEFNMISTSDYHNGGIICKTCYEWWDNSAKLKEFRRKEYLNIVKRFPLLNGGDIWPKREQEPNPKEVCYNDLTELQRDGLNAYL